MKNLMLGLLAICFILTGCDDINAASKETETTSADASKIHPLPDTTMDNLSDAVLSVSLDEGDAYVDNTGKMQMDLTIYSYDKFDMVDVSMLKVGDILVTHTGEVEITDLEREDNGTILINGGLNENGMDLITEESGYFYECSYNDTKNWYKLGEATIQMSSDFIYHDTFDLDKGQVLYYPSDFLVGEITDYQFTPDNTTVRVENGQIVEMNRRYIP